MSDEPELLIEDAGGVRTITLNRPDRLNALTMAMRRQIEASVREFDADDDLRVLLVAGNGRGFCAGTDLRSGQEDEKTTTRDRARLRFWWHLPFDETDKPTICAVHGVAAGGGIGLALSCDLVIASEAATFAPAFIALAITPDNGLAQTLVRRMGYPQALKFLLQGERLDASRALALGVVDEVIPAVGFAEAARASAQQIADQPPVATLLTKRLLKQAPAVDRAEGLALEELLLGIAQATPESVAAREAFANRGRS